jgi:hypothetical protein
MGPNRFSQITLLNLFLEDFCFDRLNPHDKMSQGVEKLMFKKQF